ncbi:Transposase associated domain-containing protein [Forsythia ovata]|uniref:Transposase associated domain-containing protein n=1 Tax=Forsythia ovata TaxID=205694 RepID=A0ABD1WVL2_9LAMI
MNDVNKEILYEHLTCRRMMSNYKVWHLHGEKFETTPTPKTTIDNIDGECGESSDGGDHDYIIDMLRDRFERPVVDEDMDGVAEETDGVSSDEFDAAFCESCGDGRQKMGFEGILRIYVLDGV